MSTFERVRLVLVLVLALDSILGALAFVDLFYVSDF